MFVPFCVDKNSLNIRGDKELKPTLQYFTRFIVSSNYTLPNTIDHINMAPDCWISLKVAFLDDIWKYYLDSVWLKVKVMTN